tara:strand:+ start:236 stop:481 length:246 start_codon:yes stop_codon:yes gene_type:complete
MANTVEQIIAYETGELDYEGTLNLFSKLIKSGQAWSLQGHYGRTAKQIIELNLISKDGKITQHGLDSIENVKQDQMLLQEK